MLFFSDHIHKNNRRYLFDLKQNKRGYFLKVSRSWLLTMASFENMCEDLNFTFTYLILHHFNDYFYFPGFPTSVDIQSKQQQIGHPCTRNCGYQKFSLWNTWWIWRGWRWDCWLCLHISIHPWKQEFRKIHKNIFNFLEEDELNLPEPKEVRVELKRFYFDVGNNNRGVFLRLSEVPYICLSNPVY